MHDWANVCLQIIFLKCYNFLIESHPKVDERFELKSLKKVEIYEHYQETKTLRKAILCKTNNNPRYFNQNLALFCLISVSSHEVIVLLHIKSLCE